MKEEIQVLEKRLLDLEKRLKGERKTKKITITYGEVTDDSKLIQAILDNTPGGTLISLMGNFILGECINVISRTKITMEGENGGIYLSSESEPFL